MRSFGRSFRRATQLNRYIPNKMTESTTILTQYLSTEYSKFGFVKISLVLSDLPDKMTWLGGIEKKTFNLHRAVCIVEYSGEMESFYPAMLGLKKSLHKSLKAKFWRGLGIGLIIYSSDLIENELLEKSVYSAEKASTSLIQWIINLSHKSDSAKIAHTFSEVSTSSMIDEILDFIEIQAENRIVIISEQVSLLKTKLI